jgi:RNA polymerase sigma-70 factor (ECF subfamily)
MTKAAVVTGLPNSAHSPDLTPRPNAMGALGLTANGTNGKPAVSPERQALDQRIVELVKLFRESAGERKEDAFNELAPLAGRMAYHLALRSVADSSVAEDISQEALTRLYKHVGEIAGEGAFKTWFYRIVANLVHDHFRRAVRQDSAKSTLEELRAVENKSRSEPLSNLERTGLRTALNDALACLDEKHREAFLMKEVQGLSHAEIAETLDVPEGTVWSRLSYARRKLQEKLKRMGYGG